MGYSRKLKFIILMLVFSALFLAACGRNASGVTGDNGIPDPTVLEWPYMPIPENYRGFIVPSGEVIRGIEIMNFEGHPVFENELFFVAQMMGLDLVQSLDLAMEQLIEFYAVIARANRNGLGITADERADVLHNALMTADFLGLSDIISDERLVDFFLVGNLLTNLIDHYVYHYIPNVQNYLQEFDEFADANYRFLANIELLYIVNPDARLMFDLHDRFTREGVAGFEDAVRDHSILYVQEEGVVTYTMHTFEQIFGLYEFDRVQLFDLMPGQLSHIFAIEDFYFLVYAINRRDATNAEIEEAFISHTMAQMRTDSIDDLLDTWIDDATFTINHDALDALR